MSVAILRATAATSLAMAFLITQLDKRTLDRRCESHKCEIGTTSSGLNLLKLPKLPSGQPSSRGRHRKTLSTVVPTFFSRTIRYSSLIVSARSNRAGTNSLHVLEGLLCPKHGNADVCSFLCRSGTVHKRQRVKLFWPSCTTIQVPQRSSPHELETSAGQPT